MSTLILYATKYGTAEKCATILAKKLSGKVDLLNLKAGVVPDLAQYDTVVVGGSIYAGNIQKGIRDYCTQNLSHLKSKKLGLYICSMFDKSAEVQLKNAFPQELLEHAVVKGNFGGEMLFSKMSFGEKLLTKMVSKMIAKENPEMAIMDTKKDISVIIEENIAQFAQKMMKG